MTIAPHTTVPERVLAHGQLNVAEGAPKETFAALTRVVAIWKKMGSEQFLMLKRDDSKTWECVPYPTTSSIFIRIFQQLFVTFNFSFGTSPLNYFPAVAEYNFKRQLVGVGKSEEEEEDASAAAPPRGDDAFCKPDVIAKQQVFEGEHTTILYNYAPVVDLHFLIVPKAHRADFNALTEAEYCEISNLSDRLVGKLREEHDVKHVYVYHKTGRDAGQTVDHFHLHVVATTAAIEDWRGKATVFKNILIGSSPLPGAELAERVGRFTQMLQSTDSAPQE